MNKTYNGKAYRFLSFEGLQKTIESEQLRLTNPILFNDPIDNSSYIAPLDWEQWKKINLAECAEKKYSKKIFSTLYIASFSKEYNTENSYLMWAHYAKEHKGVCFEIDFGKNKFLGNPEEVTYDDLRKKRNEIREKYPNNFSNLSNEAQNEIGYFLVTYKHKVWEYEKEIRLVVDSMLTEHKKGFRKSIDEKYLFVDFDLNLISKIIFGIKADPTEELIIKNMLKSKGISPKFEKMYIDPVTLNLESKPYFEEK